MHISDGTENAVVMCVDQGYLPFALFMAEQLDRFENSRNFDICLISDDVLSIPQEFSSLGIRVFGPVDDPDYLRLTPSHLPRSTYLRLWAPRILAKHYRKAIYLDADMFIEGAGLSGVFGTDLGRRAIGAVRDVQQWYRPRRNPAEFRNAGLPSTPYFNAGMLLIDCARYEELRIMEKCLDIAKTQPGLVRHHDQSLLNIALKGDWTELPPIWNWQWSMKYPLFTDWTGPRIHHFIGETKPWNDAHGYSPRRFHMAYAAFFARHFPDRAASMPAPGPSPLQDWKRSAWLSLRFWALRRKLLRYLSTFPA